MNIRTRLMLTPVAAAVGFLIVGGLSAVGTRASLERIEQLGARGLAPVVALQSIQEAADDIRFRGAGFALGQVPAAQSAEKVSEALATVRQAWGLARVQLRSPGTANELAQLDAAMPKLEAYVQALTQAFAAKDVDAVRALMEDDWPYLNANLMKPLSAVAQATARDAVSIQADAEAQATQLGTLSAVAGGLALLLVVALSLLTARRVGQDVRHISDVAQAAAAGNLQVRSVGMHGEFGDIGQALNTVVQSFADMARGLRDANGEILQLSEAVARESHQLALRNETVMDQMLAGSGATEEMAQAAREIAAHAGDASGAAQQALASVEQGVRNMHATLTEVRAVFENFNLAADSVGELTQHIDNIGSVAQIIREIADQTNLLALNAAIEAARAGEQGRGFAVVADEVRKLAEKTSQSTNQISEGVTAVHGAANSARSTVLATQTRTGSVASALEAIQAELARIQASASSVATGATSIADATREQWSAADTTATSLAKVSQVTEESSRQGATLQGLVDRTVTAVQRMQALVARYTI